MSFKFIFRGKYNVSVFKMVQMSFKNLFFTTMFEEYIFNIIFTPRTLQVMTREDEFLYY